MLAVVTVVAEAITPCISLKERKMKKHIEKTIKLTASECLALAILRLSLEQILGSNEIVFTQVDLSGEEKVAQTGARRMELKIIHIEALFANIDTPGRHQTSVEAYITLEKQKLRTSSIWRPSQVSMNVKNCGLKMPFASSAQLSLQVSGV